MKLKEIMTQNVESISPNASLVEAANKMKRFDIGFLPVLEGDTVGVVTDRDIVVRAIAEGSNPSETSVGDILTTGVEMLSQEEGVETAARLMKDQKIRRILIKDERNAYVGVVSLGDLAAAR